MIFPISSNVNNYTPTSSTLVIPKVFKTVNSNQLCSFSESERPRSDLHYGFQRRSTGDSPPFVSRSWSAAFGEHEETRLVFLDISKAFGWFWHEGLLAKLTTFRLSPASTLWTSGFLSERTISFPVIPCESRSSPRSSIHAYSVLSVRWRFIHYPSFAGEATLHCSCRCSCRTPHQADTNIITSVSLNSDLQYAFRGSNNHFTFSDSKTSFYSISLKHHRFSLHLTFDSTELHSTDLVSLFGLSTISSLCWSCFMSGRKKS